MFDIVICAFNEVEQIVADQRIGAVLSFEHPGVCKGERGHAPRIAHIPQHIITCWDTEDKSIPQGPEATAISDGLNFALNAVRHSPLLIHCNAGRARSTAMALGVLSALYPQKNEASLIDMLYTIRPIAAPNIIIVEMVDLLTAREGRLHQAILNDDRAEHNRIESERRRIAWIKRNPAMARMMFPEKLTQGPT